MRAVHFLHIGLDRITASAGALQSISCCSSRGSDNKDVDEDDDDVMLSAQVLKRFIDSLTLLILYRYYFELACSYLIESSIYI